MSKNFLDPTGSGNAGSSSSSAGPSSEPLPSYDDALHSSSPVEDPVNDTPMLPAQKDKSGFGKLWAGTTRLFKKDNHPPGYVRKEPLQPISHLDPRFTGFQDFNPNNILTKVIIDNSTFGDALFGYYDADYVTPLDEIIRIIRNFGHKDMTMTEKELVLIHLDDILNLDVIKKKMAATTGPFVLCLGRIPTTDFGCKITHTMSCRKHPEFAVHEIQLLCIPKKGGFHYQFPLRYIAMCIPRRYTSYLPGRYLAEPDAITCNVEEAPVLVDFYNSADNKALQELSEFPKHEVQRFASLLFNKMTLCLMITDDERNRVKLPASATQPKLPFASRITRDR